MIAPGDDLFGGRYHVLQPLGTGSFGEALLVEDTRLGVRRVVKVAHTATAVEVERLAREHAVLSRLDDPAFARVFDVGQLEDGRAFLVAEWVEGERLDELLRREGRMPPGNALAVGRALARGLGRLHEAGFVHRDIKPSNVMIPRGRAFDSARLPDFSHGRGFTGWTSSTCSSGSGGGGRSARRSRSRSSRSSPAAATWTSGSSASRSSG